MKTGNGDEHPSRQVLDQTVAAKRLCFALHGSIETLALPLSSILSPAEVLHSQALSLGNLHLDTKPYRAGAKDRRDATTEGWRGWYGVATRRVTRNDARKIVHLKPCFCLRLVTTPDLAPRSSETLHFARVSPATAYTRDKNISRLYHELYVRNADEASEGGTILQRWRFILPNSKPLPRALRGYKYTWLCMNLTVCGGTQSLVSLTLLLIYSSIKILITMFDLSIGLLLAAASTTFAQNIGTWTSPIRFPIVPVAAAPLPGSNGQLLVWSGFNPADFESGKGRTQTAIYNPATGAVSRRTVTNTRHDMSVIVRTFARLPLTRFCPGISFDF